MTKHIDIPDEVIGKLHKLIGIDLIVAMKIFKSKGNVIPNMRGYNKEIGGFPEELIAFVIGEQRPTSSKGRDFTHFEVKSIKGEARKRGGWGTKGDTPVSSFTGVSFFESNIWAKLRKMLVVVHHNNIVVDIRFFSGEDMVDVLKDDYELISQGKRTECKILTLKEKTKSIQIKYQGAIKRSLSICDPFLMGKVIDNKITNQEQYILELFGDALTKHKQLLKEKQLTTLESIKKFINSPHTSIREIEKLRRLLDDKLNNILGYDDTTDSNF